MDKEQIKDIQRRIGTTPDGYFGPKSRAALQQYLRNLGPADNPWPKSDQQSLTEFFGKAGDEDKLINLDVSSLGLKYEGAPVRTLRCHTKVGASLRRVLAALSTSHPAILAKYAGCFNNRAMRGGSLPSLHARGAAVDFDPDTNANSTPWPEVADMPLEVMEAFAREGWLAAGAFWGRDAMHFQATQ